MATEAGSGRPFLGRVEIVESLYRQLEDTCAGTGGVTLLVGEAGVGKSALVDSLLEQARARRVPGLVGRALALDAPPPFALLRSAIESVRDDPTLASAGVLAVGGEPVLISFGPRAGEPGLPDLVSIEERLLDALGGADDRGERSRDWVLTNVAEQFHEFLRRGPMLLVLEDVHRADDSSLAAVKFLAERLEHEPLWVLATSRPFESLSATGRARLEGFEKATRARQLVLRPMSSREVGDYLALLDPSRSFSPAEVTRRFAKTGGNPLLLQQLDRPSPPGVAAQGPPVAGASTLDPEEERVLEVAAVLGPEFSFNFLVRVSGEEDEERFAEIVDDLVTQGWLAERPGELLAFPGDRLREAAYGRLSEHRRQLLHWSAGETLESMGSAGIATIYALARHFYLGRVGEKSVRYNRLAAEIADRALAPDVAREHLARALESVRDVKPENIEEESELVLELARVTEELGRLPEAEEVLRGFLVRESHDPRLASRRRASLEVFLSRVLTDRGNLPAASELATKVLDTPGLDDQPLVRVGAHHQLGMVLYYEGRYPEALLHHTEELRLARQVGNPLVTLRARIWRVAALAMMGPTDEAVAEAREITTARDRLGSTRESAQAHLFLGDMLADARCTPSQRQEAIAEYAKAAEFAEQAGDPRRVGWAEYKTGELLRETGRFEEATETLRSACDIFSHVGDQVGLSMATKVQGQVAMDRGAYDVAEDRLLEAHRLLRGLDHTLEELDVVLRLAQLSFARGDSANARRHLAQCERQKLTVLRPDLVSEFARLKQELDANEGVHAAP